MLYPAIIAGWLTCLYLGTMMCRLAARSDRSQARALAEWVRSSYFTGAIELAGAAPERQGPDELLPLPAERPGDDDRASVGARSAHGVYDWPP